MSWQVAVALAGLGLTMVVGFGGLMRALGRIEHKMELMWTWYVAHHSGVQVGGRRRDDPEAEELARNGPKAPPLPT